MIQMQTSVDEALVRLKAYELWEARGCPIGSPERDWFEAMQSVESTTHAARSARDEMRSAEGAAQPSKAKPPLGLYVVKNERTPEETPARVVTASSARVEMSEPAVATAAAAGRRKARKSGGKRR